MGLKMWDKIVYIFIIMIVMFLFKHKLRKKLKRAEYYLKFSFIFFVFLFQSFIFIPILIWNGRNVNNGRLLVCTANVVGKILGMTWIIRNPEIVSEDRGAVIVSNHQSVLDTMHLCQLLFISKKIAIVAKKALLYMWPFGFAIYMTDAIFLDRRNPTDANQLLLNKSKRLLQNKVKLLIFPEGTRNDNPTKFLPFKKGAFNLAVQTQVPIIPVVISWYYFLDHHRHIFSNGNVIAQCLEPISTEGLTLDDVPDLINRVKSAMEKVYKELSNEVTKDLPPDYPLATNEANKSSNQCYEKS